jgi:hypothetical protein
MVGKPEEWNWSSFKAASGKESPHPCLTTDWVLRQFSAKGSKAQLEYRRFVSWGIGKESVWNEVKGQTLLGEDAFVEGFSDHLARHKEVPEIPKSQRYANRPALNKIFTAGVLKDKQKRDRKIAEAVEKHGFAVEKHGYTQRAIADHLVMHYSSVSQILSRRARI